MFLDLVEAAEADRLALEKKLEESNAKAMQFQDQVSQMIDQITKDKLETDSRHRQEVADARAAGSSTVSSGTGRELVELQQELEKVRAEKEDLIVSVEADVLQFTALLDEERCKHMQVVESATETGCKLEAALERAAQLEEALQEMRGEHERALSLEKLARQQAQNELSARQNSDTSTLTDLKNQLMVERNLKEALLLENSMLKQQAADKKRHSVAAREAAPAVVFAPPVAPREAELSLQSKPRAGATGAEKKTSEASTALVAAELAKQRAARAKTGAGQQEDKVATVVSRMSQDLGKGPVTDSSGTVSRSRANEILLRAKALAAKTKGEMEGK
jgi:hypothetical protein